MDDKQSTFIQTKLYRPRVSGNLVSRPRLLERLQTGLSAKMTLISAPAGFGKTTLAAGWLATLGVPLKEPAVNDPTSPPRPTLTPTWGSAWLSLDQGDNDPVRFFTYLAAALAGVDPGLARAISEPLQSSQPPAPEALVGRLVNGIVALDKSFVLALDDFHRIDSRLIHAWLAALLAHQPPQLHLLIVTREDPPLPLAGMRGRGELIDIRQGDLSFNAAETAAFLNDLMGLKLNQAEIDALEARTEGWIAGLQLAALSLRGRGDAGQFIYSFAGSNRYIMEYLLEEVFRQQTDGIQRFLLQTSILDLLCGPLCDALLFEPGKAHDGRRNGQATLEYLDGVNLFIVPLDEERGWYRYHHLFADLLRHRLQQEKQDLSELHGRASQWFEDNGYPAEAISHGLAARDWRRVAGLVESVRQSYLQMGQISTLLRWIQAIPAEVVRSRPALCMTAAWALALSGNLEAAESTIESARQLVPQHPELTAEILILEAHLARARHDVRQTISLSEEALAHLPPDDFNSRSVLGVNLGAAYLYAQDFERALAAWAAAAQEGQRSGNLHAALLSLTFMGQIRAAWGQLHQAADLHRQAIRLGVERGAAPAAARAHVNLARLLVEWNDLEAAGHHLQQAQDLSRQSSDPNVQRDALRLQARLRQATGDPEGALTAMGQAHRLVGDETPDNAYLATALSHMNLALAQGDPAMAARWLARIEQQLPGLGPLRFDLVANAACLAQIGNSRARLFLAQGRRQAAAELLVDCYQAAADAGLVYTQVGGCLLQALAAGDERSAVDFLAQALSLAQAEGYVHTFLEEGQAVRRLLQLAAEQGIAPDYCAFLLAQFGGPVSGFLAGPAAANLPDMLEVISEREMEILSLLARGYTNAEIAQALIVSPNTVKTHLQRIYEKLAVHNRRAAVARARELNLLRS